MKLLNRFLFLFRTVFNDVQHICNQQLRLLNQCDSRDFS